MRHRADGGLVLPALAQLADLVLCRECGGCGRPGTSWCSACWPRLLGIPRLRRLVGPAGGAGLPVWSSSEYGDVVRAAIVTWKDRGRADLTPVLAGALRRSVLAAVTGPEGPGDARAARSPVLLVPAPSSRRSRRRRGHEPVRDLAVSCARGLRRRGVDVRVVPVLAQARRLQDQAGLGAAGRAANVAGALRARSGWLPHLLGRDCVVVDDVVTTGATLLECCRVLTEAGVRVRGAATVAATRRQDGLDANRELTRSAAQTQDR